MKRPKKKAEAKFVWTQARPHDIVHEVTKPLSERRSVTVVRRRNTDYGLVFVSYAGAIRTTSNLAISTEAMEAVVELFNVIKDKPITFAMDLEVTAKAKTKAKVAKRKQTAP